MSNFQLDSHLANDTFLVGSYKLCEVRLMDDSRWPWLILVPKVADLAEIHDVSSIQQEKMAFETASTAKALKKHTNCEKINSAAIGNIVRQLHIHVIARNQGDANWPGPVWGFGERQPYDNGANEKLIFELQQALATSANFTF
ncbi:MAG: HIT domain-containing protein [Rhizobiaceae bacterium]|nr:HIT domain-containing protein [Rhizobiaceae bacterium]